MKPRPDLTLELNDLILNASSLVRLESNTYHIALHPSSLTDLKSAIKEKLDFILYKFDFKFGGFLLGYKNVKIASDRGSLINDDFFIHFNIIADFYIFSPKVGCVLYGIVNKKSADHIGCLVHKFFNVSIPRPANETREDWIGTLVEIGHQVTFVLKVCDFTGNLPYMRGSVLSSSPANSDDAQPESKKSKKLQYNKVQEDTFTIFESQLEEISDRLAKRKREFDDEPSTSRKKKRKSKLEGGNEEKYTESNALHMSSEDPDYGEVIQHIEESYLKENAQDLKKKNVKETITVKKRKLFIQNELTDIPQNLHSEIKDASEQAGNKKKKHKKHHDTDKKSELVLPDLVSLMESYKSSTQKLNKSLSASEKESELKCSSQNKKESSPSISYLLNKAEKLADDSLKKKKKDKHENANINTESQEKHKKKKKRQDSLEKSDIGISTIKTTYKRESIGNGNVSEQSESITGRKQAAEIRETKRTVGESVKGDKSKKKQASDILYPSSVLSRIARVFSDSDTDISHIPKVNKGKGEQKSLLSTPPTQSSLLLNSNSNSSSRKSVSFSEGGRLLSPENPLDALNQLLKAKFSDKADSNITTSILKNYISPSKPKKDKKLKSSVQESQHLNLLKTESSTLKKKEEKGSKTEWSGLDMLKALAFKSLGSPQSEKAVKNIVNAHDTVSPLMKCNALNIAKDGGKDIPDKGFAIKANVKDKPKMKKKKDREKNRVKDKKEKKKNKSKHSDKKRKDSKIAVNVNTKKLKKKGDKKNRSLNNIDKLSKELLQKIMKEQGAS